MHKKFEINPTKIKGSCQSGSKVVTHDSKSDLPLVEWSMKEGRLGLLYFGYGHCTLKEPNICA